MSIFLGLGVSDYVSVGYLALLGDLSVMDGKTYGHSLNVSNPLEESSYFIFHCPGIFWFVRTLHKVPVLIDLACVRADDHIRFSWLNGDFSHVDVTDFPVLSSLDGYYR